jgi:serine/threonine protein kinase
MIGEIIANYKIISLLGEGGMGTVYLAEHEKLGRKVAIKVLLPHLVKNELVRSRFINEAKLMSSLHHPNIVTLFDYVEDKNGLSLIMEFVEGQPLDEQIQKVTGPIEESAAINLIKQALEGFAYAHKKGLVHRDIKPSNLIITEENELKILDFGIAKLVGDAGNKLTKTGSHIGTVYYMSPEQVRGYELDLRSDIYALGVTFYQMLTGLCPYEGLTTEFDVFNKIVGEELPDPRTVYPGISEHMCRVIQKATAKKPENRFQNCSEFIKGLENDDFNLLEIEQVDEKIPVPVVSVLEEEKVTIEQDITNEDKLNKEPKEKEIDSEKRNTATSIKLPEKNTEKDNNSRMALFIGLGIVLLLSLILIWRNNQKESSNSENQIESTRPESESTDDKVDKEPNIDETTNENSPNQSRTTNNKRTKSESKETQYDQEVKYVDPAIELTEVERQNPLNNLSIDYEWRKTIIDDIKINLSISNSATYVSFTRFFIKVTYFDKNGGYKGEANKIMNNIIKPGYYYTEELKFTPPFGVRSIDVKLISALSMN